eukprot:TRINITY_DN8679_c1_g1_i1.p3 TRINITY_DN8679_c1_g1~~TRINITY_DN8679_c1_g1_i1.p3  ORF type:complete len:125 (+),score=14.48 TRINITY_DN8679_c1_g1_i1:1236-1610(+)
MHPCGPTLSPSLSLCFRRLCKSLLPLSCHFHHHYNLPNQTVYLKFGKSRAGRKLRIQEEKSYRCISALESDSTLLRNERSDKCLLDASDVMKSHFNFPPNKDNKQIEENWKKVHVNELDPRLQN